MRRFIWIGLATLLVPQAVHPEPLVPAGAPWSHLSAADLSPQDSSLWYRPEFNDSGWPTAPSGFFGGFGAPREASWIRDLDAQRGTHLFRARFHLEDPSRIRWLSLRLDYQHGFAAYLNGTLVASQGLGQAKDHEYALDEMADPHHSGAAQLIDLSQARQHLNPGDNVLAVQVHGRTLATTGLVFNAELLTNLVRGPFLQRLTGKSVTIVWQTHQASTGGVDIERSGFPSRIVPSPIPAREHAVRIEGLQPGAVYTYRLRIEQSDGQATTKPYEFRTAPRQGKIRFAVLGDSGQGSRAQFDIAAQIRNWGPDLVLHGGDVVYPEFSMGRVDFRCFSVFGQDMASRPYHFAAGNHDVSHGLRPFLDSFHQFTNNTPLEIHQQEGTAPELYFSFDYGEAHFVVLYMPFFSQYVLRKGNPQYEWLVDDLQTSNQAWKFIVLHHTVLSSSAHFSDDWDRNGKIDQEELAALLFPLAHEYGVQMIFTGHDHVFERFSPQSGVQVVTSGGGGGGLYQLARRHPSSAQFWRAHHFVSVTINGPELELEARSRSGSIFDRAFYRRATPLPPDHAAPWHRPQVEPDPGNPLTDHNLVGQTYDLVGPGVIGVTGTSANLGRLRVNHDAQFLYIGLESPMMLANQLIFLFLGRPGEIGTRSLPLSPASEALLPQAFTQAEALAFQGFEPLIGCLLGDEAADQTDGQHHRPSFPTALGEGVFSLVGTAPPISGSRIQQFDHSPLLFDKPHERTSNLIELAIPKSALASDPDATFQSLQVAAVVGTVPPSGDSSGIAWDTGFLGETFHLDAQGKGTISPLKFRLLENPDPDEDHLMTSEETRRGTDPSNPDTDGDGLPDGWEVRYQLDPLDPSEESSGLGDPDRDHATNLQEFHAGTDPHDPRSVLSLSAELLGQGIVKFSWSIQPSIHYELDTAPSPSGPYTPVPSHLLSRPTASTQEYFDRGAGQSQRFFRLTARRLAD